MPRPPTSHAQAIRAFCATPRTRAEIVAKFGNESKVIWSVRNLVKRGELQNLNAHLVRGVPGVYFAAADESPARHTDGGAALAQAWGMRA